MISLSTGAHLLAALEHLGDIESVRKRGGVFVVRNLLNVSPEVRELADSEANRALVESVLVESFFFVRAILFDKLPTMRATPEVVYAVGVGGALLIATSPASRIAPSRVPGHRRVVHLDFAPCSFRTGCGGS